MIARGDFWLAIAAAAGLHIGALSLWPAGNSGGGSGADGDQTLSIATVDPAFQALVDSWERPPVAASVSETLPAPSLSDAPPVPDREAVVTRATASVALPDMARPEHAPPQIPTPDALSVPAIVTADVALSSKLVAPERPEPPAPLEIAMAAVEAPLVTTAPPAPKVVLPMQRPDPRPSRPAVAERRAAGTGGGATAGTATANAARAASAAQQAAAQAKWAADIQQRIARHQAYPRGTRASGRVQVTMVILRNGSLGEVTVARSSGAAPLDKAALRAVQLAAPFPPAPDALTDRWYRVGQWISFERR